MKVSRLIGILLGLIAMLVIIGTAGASDLGTIPGSQVTTQLIIGLVMLGASATSIRAAERLEELHDNQKMKRR